jgi:hypothetical protein
MPAMRGRGRRFVVSGQPQEKVRLYLPILKISKAKRAEGMAHMVEKSSH